MKKSIFILMLLSFVTFSCKDVDFGDINTDPNSPSAASSASLLTRGQLNMGATYSDTRPALYVQYLSNGQYNDESNYVTQRFDYDEYYEAITNLNRVIALNTDEATKLGAVSGGSNANQIAVARLVKAYLFHHMTDRWGMLPYTTANQGLDSKFNAFDSQSTIYNALFSEIEAALAQMDGGSGPTGDIILNGDMDMWKVFGNTLMMNMAMRLSKKEPALAQSYFNKAVAGGVIASNAQNIMYTYLEDDNHDNPWQDRFETRTDYLLSTPFVAALVGNGTAFNPEDPRLAKYGKPAASSGAFNGAPYGESNSLTDNFSFITDDVILNQTAPGYFYTYAQVSLNMAEAAQLGWVSSGTAQSYTNQGIRASMEQWGVASSDIDAYISNRTSLGGQKEIAYQKWVALFLQGYESWSDWRKQGADQVQLTKGDAALTAGIPQRHAYPLSALSSNEANYNAAISAQGEDNTDTKIWWAK
jgi:hypothetical protein